MTDGNKWLSKPLNKSGQNRKTTSLNWRQALGRQGEEYVVKLLTKKGWQVIERNWRAGRYAEIDIIAYDSRRTLIFIEVKTRMAKATTKGFPSLGYDKLDKRKIQKLVGCASLYMANILPLTKLRVQSYRFDAFIVHYAPKQHCIDSTQTTKNLEPDVEHILGFVQ